MYQEDILHRIRTYLAILEAEVKMDNQNGEFSINIHAENVLLKVLNAAFGLDLNNVNYEESKKNYPAIDLRDDAKKVVLQITSTGTVEKVVHTLKQCAKHGFDKKYKHLVFYFLKGKDANVSDKNARIIKEKGSFDIGQIHFLDNAEFYNYLNEKNDIGILEQICDLLEKQYGGYLRSSEKTINTHGDFVLSHPFTFFGRELQLQEAWDCLEKDKIVIVTGEGGVGKTEFCREILAWATKKDKPHTAVNLRECRTYEDMIRRIAGQYKIAVGTDDDAGQIERTVFNKAKGILYLDNFEDIISEKFSKEEDRRSALAFLRKCRDTDTVSVLASSRYKMAVDFSFHEVPLDVLEEDAAEKLFALLWSEREDAEISEEMKRFVTNDLHCYPLSIVLVARQRKVGYSFERLRSKWKEHWKSVRVKGMENERHKSLATALDMTYAEMKDRSSERALWELFTLFPDTIEVAAAEKILEDFEDPLERLISLGVVHFDDHIGEGYLSVQPTLRSFIQEVEEYPKDIPILSQRVLDYYVDVYGEGGMRNWGTEKALKAAECLTDALFFMDWLINREDTESVGKMHTLTAEYYQDMPFNALPLVNRVLGLAGFDYTVKASLLKYCADLEMRTDKLDEADGHYREADGLFRQIHDDLGLANVLKAMGDLERRTAKLDEADGHFREAEGLFRQIHDDLGLANVLTAMGDLEKRTAKLDEADSHFREAEGLFRRIHDDLGLANVLKAMGDLEMRTDKLDEADGHFRGAEGLFRQIHNDLGLANVLMAMGDLKMRTDKLNEAEGNYREAEDLFRRIHADLGLANVLKAMGDLEMRTDKLDEADGYYRGAEGLFRRIHNDLGLANVLKAMGDLKMRMAKLEEADGHYREAEGLFRRIHDDLGLANVLKAIGDLDRRTDKLNEAEGQYREAEGLYQRIHDDLGLANVLTAMGDLEMRTDKLEEAEDHYREAEGLFRRIHNDLGLANVLMAMGNLDRRMAKLNEADGHFREAEGLFRRIHNDLGLANVLTAMGDLEKRTAKIDVADGHLREAEGLFRRIHDDLGLANVMKAMGDLERRTDKLEEAEGHYREAEGLFRRIHDDLGLANVLMAMGNLDRRMAKLNEADGHFREAEGLFRRIHNDLGLANVLTAMGDLERRTAKIDVADGHLQEAEGLFRQIHDDLGLANVLMAMGDLERRTDKLDEAECHYREAEGLFRRIHNDLGLANVLQSIGNLWQKKGDYSKAINTYVAAADLYKKSAWLMGLTYTVSELAFCYAKKADVSNVMRCTSIVIELCETLPNENVKHYCMHKIAHAVKEIYG